MGRGQNLLDAAREGDEQTVEKILGQINKRSGPFQSLVRKHAGVNVADDNGYTPLHHACLQGHKEIVRLLLAAYASPNIPDKKGATPLHLAAWRGDVHIVCMLLAHNPPVDVNQKTHDNETALLIAAQFGHSEVVAELINNGAEVNIRNIKDESALDLAAHYGRLKTVQHLIQVEPSLVQPYKYPKWKLWKFSTTPLHRASKNGQVEVVLELLKAGIDPNIRTDSGTPLHEAACFGKAGVVRILLEHGANLYAVDGRDKTIEDLLAVYSEEATRKVRMVIRDFKNRTRNEYESEEDLPPFPVRHEHSPVNYLPDSMKAQETQKRNSDTSSSSSLLVKAPHQSFVKRLASKLGLKSKFNSAPNISNTSGLESGADDKSKVQNIGNSKFFNFISKKEESGDIDCTNEFDTISLDRLGMLNRDATVNRSNRSCPGFKNSLPNISENNELSDSIENINNEYEVKDEDDSNLTKHSPVEAVNKDTKYGIFEPRKNGSIRVPTSCDTSPGLAILVNECYESYEFSSAESTMQSTKLDSKVTILPKPPPRSIQIQSSASNNALYENITVEKPISTRPTPAVRTHIPNQKQSKDSDEGSLYENVALLSRKPEPLKRSLIPAEQDRNTSSSGSSRSSSISSDSMIDESNLEDILLSEKSRSFKHGTKLIHIDSNKSTIKRTQSNASNFTDVTGASAIENVDVSDMDMKTIYLSMTGTLPTKKPDKPKKKVLFRHKTFTNIEVDRNSFKLTNYPSKNSSLFKETLAHYHIRGTGHCIYQAPTVEEFIYIFNRDTLYNDTAPFTKVPNDKRYSDFETAICFCKPKPPKHHNSAEDLLDIPYEENDAKVVIDLNDLKEKIELSTSSFQCYCDTGSCVLHSRRREVPINFVVKFSAINKSISTPDITLASSFSTTRKGGLVKNKSVPSNLEEPYAVVDLNDIVEKNSKVNQTLESPTYVQMSPHSSLSSGGRPYSIKDIAEVISLGTNSRSGTNPPSVTNTSVRKSTSSEHSGHWSLQSCNSNLTIVSDASFKTCIEESSDDGSDATLHSDAESSDAETVKSDASTAKRPWVHSSSFRFGNKNQKECNVIEEEINDKDSKVESGISVQDSETSSSECEGDSGVPGVDLDVSLDASLERVSGPGGVRSGSGRRRWEEADRMSEGDALSISSAASSCAPMHLAHHHEYSKVSPTPPKKPPRRNLSVSPTHVNSPSSGYSYELRTHARSQDDLDDLQGAKHYLKHGRSVDQYVDGKLSYSEYEENHNSPRAIPVPNPRPSLKNRTQPVAITAMYENVVIKEQNPRRKLRRNNLGQAENFETRMADKRVRKYSNQERSSLESLLDDQSMNSPSEYERYFDGSRTDIPLSPSHYDQPPTPDHPPPSAKQAENSIHERIRPLSQLIMEVVEEIRIRNKAQSDAKNS